MFLLLPLSGSETVIGAARAWNLEPLFPLLLACAGLIAFGALLGLFRTVVGSIGDLFQGLGSWFDRDDSDDDDGPPPLPPHYVRRPNLLTAAEIRFYHELQAFCRGHGLRIFAQVRIADLIQPADGSLSALRRITEKHVDFVAVDSEFRIRFAVELDDWTHGRSDRIKRDVFVGQAFATAGLPLIRFAQDWTPAMISERISSRVNISA